MSTEEDEGELIVECGDNQKEKAKNAAIQSLWTSSMKKLLDDGQYREAGSLHVAACIA